MPLSLLLIRASILVNTKKDTRDKEEDKEEVKEVIVLKKRSKGYAKAITLLVIRKLSYNKRVKKA